MSLKTCLNSVTMIVLTAGGSGALIAQAPSLASSTFYGGVGNQVGQAITITGGQIYVGGQNGETIRYAIPPGSPTASSVVSGTIIRGMTSTSAIVYPVGYAYPAACGAIDGVGDTENKTMLSRYNAASAGLINCQSSNFFPYRGSEGYYAAANDGSSVFAVGFGETCGFGNNSFVLSKYDLSGTLLDKVAEPGVNFNGFTCMGYSFGTAVALLNGNIYVAGVSKLSGEDGVYRPILMRYSPTLTRDWKVRPTDVSSGNSSLFYGLTTLGSDIYAVGSAGDFPNTDYVIEKYNESGTRLWSKVFGGIGQDVLTAITHVGNRLFAVGYTTSQGAGGLDAVLLEIDPATGNALSTTNFGGPLDDVANAVTTDGVDIYVTGSSNSFASAGNALGEHDVILLRYTLPPLNHVDDSPPVIVPVVTGVLGNNSWYTSNVNVSWNTTDPESGISSKSGCDTITLTSNTNGVTFSCSATNGVGLSTSKSVALKIDQTAPVITPTVSGTAGSNGWYTSPVNVSWTAVDPESNIASPVCTMTSLNSNTTGQVVSCSATNGAGLSASRSVTIKIDQTAPVITPTITGTLGANGWYTSNVTVNWAATDPESSVVSPACPSNTMTADTAGTAFSCSATNGAGLSSSQSVTIKRDATPPQITGLPVAGSCNLWPPNHKMVTVATASASDGLAGLLPGSFAVTGTSNEPVGNFGPDIMINGGTVQLRAERLGDGAGRVYTLTAVAKDQAGNTASASATCIVPHDQGQ